MKKEFSYIPYLFVIFIVSFMVFDFAFLKLSLETYSGTYTDNHYQKGIDFNKVYKSGIYDDKTGWKSIITISKDFSKLSFKLTTSEKEAISDATVKAKIIRPVTNKHDFYIDLNNIGNGLYESKLSLPLEGQWEIRIKAVKDDLEYVASTRISTVDLKQ